MSNLYVTEPATNGKVIIDTTSGEIEVELWGKECPKAVRNFLALSMEGYYDGVIFHRVVPGFIIQAGDPTGTGTGGESFYGEPFEDEIHPRLRFNRRGLLAEELTNKHTLFGKIVGSTIYNVLNIGQLDIDAEERPVVPPKIKGIRIIENPFDDIVPRITASERKAQHQARVEAKKEIEFREKRAKAKKNTGLLSFGDSEEIPETEVKVKKKGMTRQDLLEPAETATAKPAQSYVDVPDSLKNLGSSSSKKELEKEKEKKAVVDLKAIREQHEREKAGSSASRQAEIKRMEEDLRKLKKRTGDVSDSDSDSDRGKRRKGPSMLEEELAKYSKNRGRAAKHGSKRGRKDEEDDLLKEMSKFSSKVAKAGPAEREDEAIRPNAADEVIGEEDLEVDDDVEWMKHSLKFVVDEKELTRRAEDEYSVIDPRAKARQLADETRKEKDSHRRGMRTAADVGRRR